jgi:endonuclease-8
MPAGPTLVILKEEVAPFVGKKVIGVAGIWIHFMLFGSDLINTRKKKIDPRLQLQFKTGELNFYTCSVKLIDEEINELFDWSTDVMSSEWDEQAALNRLLQNKDALICDALMDQQIFAGVGNIIKNEVLYNTGVHPLSKVSGIKRFKLQQLVREARNYAFEFLKWKKQGILQVKWKVHRQDTCPKHGTPLKIKTLGKTKRKTYYCEKCQTLYI